MDSIQIKINDEDIADDFEAVMLDENLNKDLIHREYLKRKSQLNLFLPSYYEKPNVLTKHKTYTEYYNNYGPPEGMQKTFEEPVSVVEEIIVNEPQEKGPQADEIYQRACHRYRAIPYPGISNRMKLCRMDLSHQKLDFSQVKALSTAFPYNHRLHSLCLRDTSLTPDCLKVICYSLTDHPTLCDLDVSDNGFGSKGLLHICGLVKENGTIRKIATSGNGFGEDDAAILVQILKSNTNIHELDLSHNEFREKGGEEIAKLIAFTSTLQWLSLSWNHLRLKGAITIARALASNTSLTVLDISWNGFSNDGAKEIAKSLVKNTTLRELNLTSNRIDIDGGFIIANALTKFSLGVLRLSRNPITINVACFMLKTLKETRNTSLKVLEILGTDINHNFEVLLEQLHTTRRLEVIHDAQVIQGGVYAQRKRKQVATPGDPLALLMEYVKRSGLRLFDLFAQLDKDNSMTVSKAEFKYGMKSIKVPLTDTQIDILVDKLDADKDGEISFGEFLEGQRQFRARARRRQDSHRPSSSIRTERPKSSTINMTRSLSIHSDLPLFSTDRTEGLGMDLFQH